MARNNNNNKLNAYVRFDGSGRIVPSSLIVQSIKPKDGNWKQIDAKECCNYTTTTTTTAAPTTTTSTTVAPTTTTTTTAGLFPISIYFQGGSSTSLLCPPGSEGSGTGNFYSTTPTVQVGSIVYSSPGIPLTFGGFYYKQVGESLVFYCPADDGVVVEFNC